MDVEMRVACRNCWKRESEEKWCNSREDWCGDADDRTGDDESLGDSCTNEKYGYWKQAHVYKNKIQTGIPTSPTVIEL